MATLKNYIVYLTLIILQIVTIEAITTCYFGSWAVYRPGEGKFEIEDIDVGLCDHIIYSFIGLNSDASIKILDNYLDIENKGFERFTNLKKKNKKLKALVAIGGWSEGSTTYSKVFGDKSLRSKFIQNALAFVKAHKFDGMDIDWEYPGQRGGSPDDKKNFADLCKEMRKEFDKSKYLLTAAVSSEPSDDSYDIKSLSSSLHYIHVMTYDIHSAYDEKTGENSPLYPSPVDTSDYEKTQNVNASINGWIKKGASPKKLILGLPTYGVTYTLSSPSDNGIGAKAKGPGKKGPFTDQDGMLGYNEICKYLKEGGWEDRWSEEQLVPYAYKGDQWIGYDNDGSIGIKVDFGKKMGLGGAMIWSIETDDFRGACGPKYPLLTTIKNKNP